MNIKSNMIHDIILTASVIEMATQRLMLLYKEDSTINVEMVIKYSDMVNRNTNMLSNMIANHIDEICHEK